jgi:hypothetical protein
MSERERLHESRRLHRQARMSELLFHSVTGEEKEYYGSGNPFNSDMIVNLFIYILFIVHLTGLCQ